MSDFSVEQKLELIRQVRSRHYRNQSDLMDREQILYGRAMTKKPEAEDYPLSRENENADSSLMNDTTLGLRYAIAAVLVLLIILFDRSQTSVAGMSMEQLFSVLETDYGEAIDAWISATCLPAP